MWLLFLLSLSWAKGYNKGVASFAKSQADKKSGLNAGSITGSLPGTTSPSSVNPDDKIKSIAGGGSKPTNININLNKEMVGSITIHTTNLTESGGKIKDTIMEVLAQVLNSGNRLATE